MMKRGILPFSELFVLLAVVFLIQLAATAALNKNAEALPNERIYSIEISSANDGPIDSLRYIEFEARNGRHSALWRPGYGCTGTYFPEKYPKSPEDLKSVRRNGQCNSAKFDSELYPIFLKDSWNTQLRLFNDDINSRGTEKEATKITLTALHEKDTVLPPQITFRPSDIPEPVPLNIAYCRGQVEGEPSLKITVTEISSGKILGGYETRYDWRDQKAWVEEGTGNQFPVEIGYVQDNCETKGISDTFGILRLELLPSGPRVVTGR